MPPRKSSPEPLPGMPAPEEPAPLQFDPGRRRAFGAVPRLLAGVGIEREFVTPLIDTDFEHVSPEYLEESLTMPGKLVYNGLALNEVEYSTVLRDAATFRDAVTVQALKGHGLSNPLRRGEVEISAPMHAYEARVVAHGRVVRNLTNERDHLRKLSEFIHSRGFAHTTEGTLLIRANEAWSFSFNNLLQVVGRIRGWSVQESGQAQWALRSDLLSRPHAARMDAWEGITGVADRYANRRRLTMISSGNRVGSEIVKLQKELRAFCEENGIDRADIA